jgi:rubrerythrin
MTPERIKELRQWVQAAESHWAGGHDDFPDRTDLLAILDDYERLRESQAETEQAATQEVVRLQKKCREWEAKYLKRHEEWAKVEAELERLRDGNEYKHRMMRYWETRAEKAEAELARVRPLVEAVMGADNEQLENDVRYPSLTTHKDGQAILRAALEYGRRP